MATNEKMRKAKKIKNDEFYTELITIEKEMKYYKGHFKDKVIFCNCDTEWSNFWKYFSLNFEYLKIKKLIATHYEENKQSYKIEMYRDDTCVHTDIKTLNLNGDFRSPECIELLKEADIVITNPPFSLFREYIATLMNYDKKFIIIGNVNSINYKDIFPLIRENKIWLGASIHSGGVDFRIPDNSKEYSDKVFIKDGHHYINLSGIRWFTNLDYKKRHDILILYKKYTPEEYPSFDNYDGINVNKTCDIPCDYEGVMGVPITFIDKYNPEQFEILGITDRQNTSGLRTKKYTIDDAKNFNDLNACAVLRVGDKYKMLYARLLIKRKK